MMKPASEWAERAADDLERIRAKAPLILSLTNTVVQSLTANLLLSVGASPVMLQDSAEIAEMIRGGAQGVLINLGTLSRSQAEAMQTAVATANKSGIPWVLDPVAVGALSLRTEFAMRLKTQQPRIIRGNAAEIMALAGCSVRPKGTESTCAGEDAIEAAENLARTTGAAVLVTGQTDYATDGSRTVAVSNGCAMMTRVTGVGCSMGALTAACATVSSSPLQAAVSSAIIMGLAGEWAYAQSPHPGSFAASLIDAFDVIDRAYLAEHARIV